jgi:hypothetical protein
MRRRGRFIQYGAHYGSSGDGKTAASSLGEIRIHEVPEEWRRYAREPWRIIFPDLDWKPPEID